MSTAAVAGKNYDWPTVIGDVADDRFVRPIMVRPEGPTGATFVTGDRYPALRDNLLITTINSANPAAQLLLRVVLKPGPAPEVLRADVLIEGTYGRLRDVIQGPDGFIYLGTSNRDGRFQPKPEDDRVIRLLPVKQ